MKKIYCKNCKNEWHFGADWWCRRKLKYINQAAGVEGTERLSGVRCEEENRDNNCLDYKKKWWKFWLK